MLWPFVTVFPYKPPAVTDLQYDSMQLDEVSFIVKCQCEVCGDESRWCVEENLSQRCIYELKGFMLSYRTHAETCGKLVVLWC